jgi:acyl transferase domain-containing protein
MMSESFSGKNSMDESSQERRNSAIAIVGLAGRFPGAPTVKEFWKNLSQGVESIQFASGEELASAGVDAGLIANPDYIRASSVVHEPEFFDASFFGFSAREAEIIDPQQRVFLECAWEALEDAAYVPATYAGAIAIFAGAGMNSYGLINLFSNPEVIESVGPYQVMVGNDKDFLCSRISYKLNLRGPAVGVQTACSTSLVAVQMAFESLLRRECDMALAGGVSIPLPQLSGYMYVPGMILSRDGHCRAFDAAASGTVPGAGAGVALLKRLDDAIADGDHIYAVIRGAAINNDGSAKIGYSAPSVEGQSAVIKKSMRMAGFAPESIGYVEAHGTGTEVGDPIEVAALARAFESERNRARSCAMGSVKTNIGHLDTAAGITGLIKAALSLEHRAIPPTLHFTEANPLLDFANTPFYVNDSLVAYDKPEPFRAGVSSFGIGGTNAHVSIEEAPAAESDPLNASQLIVLSAKSATALESQSAQLLGYLDDNPSANLADIAFTLQKGRQSFQHRRVLVASDVAQLQMKLRAPHAASSNQQMSTNNAPADPAGVVFLFSGQGSQYVNMGRDLYRTTPTFRDTVDRCCEILQPHLGLDLRAVLYPEPGQEKEAERLLGETAITQPAIFVIEYAMAQLWMDCGIHPSAMAGHSIGEYVAACVAGVFSLEDALALVAARGKIIQSVPPGAMLAVGLSEQDLEPLLTPEMSVAAINSPGQAVASGPEAAIAALETTLKNKKIQCRRLRTSHAFHSPMMDSILEEYTQRVAKVKLHAPAMRYLSNVTGIWITDRHATSPEYWGSHIRSTVRFADCGRILFRDSNDALLEVGPGDTLLSLLRHQLDPRTTRPLISSMRHHLAVEDDRDTWLSAAARLWLLNMPLNWDGLHRGERRVRLSLPTYPFERQRYWIEPKKTKAASQATSLEKQPDIADWFYVPSWKRSVPELLPKSDIDAAETWLFFGKDGELAEALTSGLNGRGHIVRVRAAAGFRRVSPELYEVDPASPEDYASLIQDLQANGRWPRRIVHAWMPNSNEEVSLDRVVDLGIFSVMYLVQAMEQRGSIQPVDLNIISDRAYSILGERVSSPAGAAMNAFGGVIALECPNISCRTVDIDLQAEFGTLTKQIIAELASVASNEIVAYRGSARWIQQYEPVRLEKPALPEKIPSRVSLRTGGTYVITGGLGGVGLVLAQHLARSAKARIVLTSRTAFPQASQWNSLLASPDTPETLKRKIQGVQSIEEAGGRVLVLESDVTNPAAMRQVLSNVRAQFGPIHGILHAAGVAGAGMMQTKSRDQVLAVLTPKIHGTKWIRECLGTPELDFVLLFSSISATIPSFGLSDYAAANAYLDGFAAVYDNPSGTRVLSANWDTWREVGMAVDTPLPAAMAHKREDRLKHGIRSAEAEEVFDRLLSFPVPQVLISTRNFAALQRLTAEAIADLRRGLQPSAPGGARNVHNRPESLDNFAAAEDDVEQFIVTVWEELLGIEPIGIHDNFFNLGGHSLLGTQVLARMRERFKVDLSLRTVFEAVTPAELAQHVRVTSWASTSASSASAMEREEIEI